VGRVRRLTGQQAPAVDGRETVRRVVKVVNPFEPPPHRITFTVKGGRVHDLTAGIRMSCIPIQGGGMPLGGSEMFGFRGSVPLKRHVRFKFMGKPAFYYNEVTMSHDLWLKRRERRTITGRMRLQYSFLIPKYPIGTFSVYSCLGGARFKARAR
jgi:hypothetical protein